MSKVQQEQLISHVVSSETLENTIQKIAERIKQQGDKPYFTVTHQLKLLSELSEFDFGRYLLQNQGINGYWTHYMLTHPWFEHNRSLTELENFLLNRAPTVLATQQRFEIFLKENQKPVKNNKKLACIPCGMMGELLYLNYQDIDDIHLIGIDYDPNALNDANILAEQKNLSRFVTLTQQDAWDLNDFQEEFDFK